MQNDNFLTRIINILIRPEKTIEKINKKPTRFSIVFTGIFLYYALIFYFLFFSPNIWKNLFFIQFSGFSFLELVAFYLILILILSIFSILFILFINFLRQLFTKKGKKRKILVINHYFYSLSPFLIILTQIPFLVIFNGYYSLFNLLYFYIGIYIISISFHIFYLGNGIRITLKITWSKTIIFYFIYSLLIICLVFLTYYIIYFSNISYSWLGSIF